MEMGFWGLLSEDLENEWEYWTGAADLRFCECRRAGWLSPSPPLKG